MTKEEADNFIRIAYSVILGRPVDMHGYTHYMKELLDGSTTPSGIIKRFILTDEYRARNKASASPYSTNEDPTFTNYYTKEVDSNTKMTRSFKLSTYNDFVESVKNNQGAMGGYFIEHSRRFYEMVSTIAFLVKQLDGQPINVLDFGTSHTANMVSKALDNRCALYDCDIEHSKTLPPFIKKQFVLNLERDNLRNHILDTKMDIIIFCEVIEHLRVNPSNLFRFLKNNLAPGGYLFITTPNFFRSQNVSHFKARLPMQPYVPESMSYNQLHGYHVREYCANELMEFGTVSGLQLYAFWFSDCWDAVSASETMPPEELGNLCFVFKNSLSGQSPSYAEI
jgi:hypothetical protein